MPSTESFVDLVGCRLPIQSASLGGPIATPPLAAAVSEAGGLGMIANPSSAAEVQQLAQEVRTLTSHPVGISFLIPFVVAEAVEAAAASVEVVEFFYGDPDRKLVGLAGGDGAVVGWQTGSAAEARAAVQAGCDFVVAQGVEAGGHVRGTQTLDDVLAETLASVDVPVLAAGGVGTPERVAELLEAGAAAIRVGTRFVAAREADAHPDYVSRLIAASSQDTVLTEAYWKGWPDAPHRVLRSAIEAAEAFDGDVVGVVGDDEIDVFSVRPATREVQGEIAAMALYAGESVDHVTQIQPAAEIIAELTAAI
ncbi:MAG: nitronate monooxygenase [Solirubrobacterales bacterium]|jgi:NAD(P)H-dependent flavin oxidoreductase YrpB (nitropropane dioxygenase family)|nr:nitronate monooxygenase [Solirubrobacterales bacterium]